MNFDAINNKIISIDTIIKIAEYLEGEKEHYGKLYAYNEKLKYYKKHKADVFRGADNILNYKIVLHSGEELKKDNFEWFKEQLKTINKSNIKEIDINFLTSSLSNKKNNNENKQNTTSNDKNEVQQSSTKYPTGKTKYYIKVNYGENAVAIYKKDENGYYSIPVKAMVCSCGTATPKSGVYKTSKGYEWGTLEGGTFGRYSTRIIGGILFHSVPYTSESEDSLEYWEYDKLGTTASLGCVRLSVADTKWIFDNCEVGTQVEFYTSSDPGPLGKPTAQKISDNVECRNWDPTDTSSNSPWNK